MWQVLNYLFLKQGAILNHPIITLYIRNHIFLVGTLNTGHRFQST
jgi:hypothetical protein